MSVSFLLKLLNVYFLAMVKYFFTFPYAMLIGLSSTQAIISVTIGGISGFVVFYYFSGYIIRFFSKHSSEIKSFLKKYLPFNLSGLRRKLFREKPAFNKQSRLIVKLKNQYGFWGLVITTPLILSVPLGAFLLNKYYSRQKNVFAWMTGSFLMWSFIYMIITVIFS